MRPDSAPQERALELVERCGCAGTHGCPGCVQHLDCSEYNAVLHKDAAKARRMDGIGRTLVFCERFGIFAQVVLQRVIEAEAEWRQRSAGKAS